LPLLLLPLLLLIGQMIGVIEAAAETV